jgi:hypothetical protein
MSFENTRKLNELTPHQLADKLDEMIKNVQELAKSNLPVNQWEKDVLIRNRQFNPISRASGLALEYADTERFCQELYEIVKDGIDLVNKTSNLYQAPEPLKYIQLDVEWNNMAYNPVFHSIKIGLPYISVKRL